MTGKALAGEVPFHWRTDFDFPWPDGWLDNQDGRHLRARHRGGDPRQATAGGR